MIITMIIIQKDLRNEINSRRKKVDDNNNNKINDNNNFSTVIVYITIIRKMWNSKKSKIKYPQHKY